MKCLSPMLLVIAIFLNIAGSCSRAAAAATQVPSMIPNQPFLVVYPQQIRPVQVIVALAEYALLRAVLHRQYGCDSSGQNHQLWLALTWIRLAISSQKLFLRYALGTVRPAVMALVGDVAGAILGDIALQPTLWRWLNADNPLLVAELAWRLLVRLVRCDCILPLLDWDRPLRLALNEIRLIPLRWRHRRQLVRIVSQRALPRVQSLPRDVVDMHVDTARFMYWNRVTGPILQLLFAPDSTWIDVGITVLALAWFLYALYAALIKWDDSIHIWTYQLSSQGITIKKLLGDVVVVVYCISKLVPYLLIMVRSFFQR